MVMIFPVLEVGLPRTALFPKAELLVEIDAAFIEGECAG
jgi:hypothetical protein